MGSIVGRPMREMTEENQRFMLEMQRLTLERQIQMQNQMRERQMAMQISRARELFNWWASFYGLTTIACLAGFTKTKNPGALVPLLPLTFVLGYQADMAYYTKMQRIRGMADDLMDKEADMLLLPHGLPTFDDIEAARNKSKQ